MSDNNINLNQENIQRPTHRVNVIMASLVSFFCCLFIPFSSHNAISIANAVICSAFAVMISSRRFLTAISLSATFLFFGYSGGLPIISIIFASAIGGGAFAWLINKTMSPFLAVIPVLAYSISTAVTKNMLGSLATLLFIMPALILARTYSKMNARASALFKTSAGYLGFVILAVVATVLYFTGEFQFEVISEFLNNLRDNLVSAIAAVEIPLPDGETQKLMTETEAFNYVSRLISLLPALVTVLCCVTAYFAQKVQFSLFIHTEGAEEFNELRKIFIVSPVPAVIFILSFLIYTLTAASAEAAVAATVCSNLYLIFMPGLAFMGIKMFISKRQNASGHGCSFGLTSMLFIALVLLAPGAVPVMAACYGAFAAIEVPLRKHFAKKNNG